ncbi:MAG: hypothetical protein ABI175_21630 [Polyangiales bacterium]
MARRELQVLALVIASAALLGLPFLRYVGWLGDEGTWLHGASRLLRGEPLYAGFFRLFPGVYFIVAGWMKVFGSSLLSIRVLALASITGVTGAAYLGGRLSSGSRVVSAICALTFALTGHGPWTTISHHWFSALFGTAAVTMALSASASPRPRPLMLAAVLAGAAAMMTPPVGAIGFAATATAALHVPRGNRLGAAAAIVLGALLVPAASLLAIRMSGVTVIGASADATSKITRFGGMQGIPFGAGSDAHNVVLVYAFPFVFLATLALAIRSRGALVRDPPCQVALVAALGAFVTCWPRPDVVHISFRAAMALPLFALVVTRGIAAMREAASTRWRTLRLGAGLVTCALLLAWTTRGYIEIVRVARASPVIATSKGPVAFGPGTAPEELGSLIATIAQTPDGAGFFFYPYEPMLPYLLSRRQVTLIDIFTPGHTTSAQYDESCRSLMTQAEFVVIDTTWTDPEMWKEAFPALEDPRPPETRAFEAALERAFVEQATFGRYRLLRRAAASPDLCAAIGRGAG